MKALKLVWGAVRFVGHAAWGLLTLAGQKPDDEECGVDLGGQGRVSWRRPLNGIRAASVQFPLGPHHSNETREFVETIARYASVSAPAKEAK
ncbi:MAG TPA: hypothetical protein PKZ07_20355 [Sedimentisphaerales bacterium]|nr:hypothetical protein [Sedimentisphaerales bacterium]